MVGEAVLGDGSVDGGTAGDGCALPAAAPAYVLVPAAATAPASEEVGPATDSSLLAAASGARARLICGKARTARSAVGSEQRRLRRVQTARCRGH